MNWKKLGKALLFPPMVLMLLLIPISTALLSWAMSVVGTESPWAYFAYVLSAYTLAVWCFKIPHVIKAVRTFKQENPLAKKWKEDVRFRINVSLYPSLGWNLLYGVFQLWLGLYHKTFWFLSLGTYYICLGFMRFFLLLHTRKYAPGEKVQKELRRYRFCGWVFLIMNLALSLIVFFMVYWNRTFQHHMITAIAMAAYTFTAFTTAIVGAVKCKKYQSPVLSAAKNISLAAAAVSMLTLESTMLTTFGKGTVSALERKIFLGATGGVIAAFVLLMAVRMILLGARGLQENKNEVQHEK